jgi:hypothetical protein
VVTLEAFSVWWSHLLGTCACTSCPASPVLLELKRICTLCDRKWTAFCGWQSSNYTPTVHIILMRCTWTNQHQFTDLNMSVYGALWWKTLSIFFFFFWRTYGNCWNFLATMDTTLHSHRNSLSVRWFITSLLSSRSYLSEQEDETQFPLSFSRSFF